MVAPCGCHERAPAGSELTIDPEFVDPEDVETLQDAIVAALNDAQTKAQELMQTQDGRVRPGECRDWGSPVCE